jgi:glycosyltransferase involved in cell wall biosynthesis
MSAKISIVTIVYNGRDVLERTINSVIDQTYDNIEYIVVDGNSNDGTVDIIKRYEDRIHIWISEEDGGIYDAINKGIALASGDIVGIIHSGDYYYKDAIKNVAEIYNSHGDDSVYFGNMEILDPESMHRTKRIVNIKSFFFMRSGMSIPHPSIFIPLKLYEKYGVYDIKYAVASDYDLLFRYIMVNKINFIYIDKILSCFTLGGVSSNILKTAREAHIVRINNGIGKFESSIYLLKSLLFYYIVLIFKAIGAGYVVDMYRRHLIKTHANI